MATRKFLYVDSNGDYLESAGAFESADFINTSAGAGDAGKPIVLDAAGHIDATMINDADIDHGSIGGLGDDDHTQYILVDGSRAFTGDQSMGTNQLTNVGVPTASAIDSASDDAIPMSFLASTASGEGASTIGIQDASSYYTGTDLESVFNEIESQIGGATSSTFNFTEANVLVDNDSIYPALEKLDLKWGDLASTANGEGASLVSIEDAGSYFTATTVEGALQELAVDVAEGKDYIEYTVGTGGVTKGDLVYISANDTVLPYATLTNAHRGMGLAATTEIATATVQVLANDEVLSGVLTAATAGTPYYWDGSAYTTSIPSGSGSHVWQVGVAKNASDLHTEVRFIKINV